MHPADLLADARSGARSLARHPGYAAVVLATLALAIGANTIIFSFADLFLLRPLPVGDPARVVFLYSVDAARGVQRGRTSAADFLDWRTSATVFEDVAAFTQSGYTLTGDGEPLRITAMRATASLARVWDLRPIAGRTFARDEDRPGAERVALLSHRFWSSHFLGDPGVLGRSLMLSGEPYKVVGILGPAIEIGNLNAIDVWVPLTVDASGARRDDRSLGVAALLKPGATIERANAELAAIAARLQRDHPDTNGTWSAHALKLREAIAGPDAWIILALLAVVVGFVLLIACANVANMTLARQTTREKEMAVRRALGASRTRLVSQLVVECAMLGAAGGALGLAVALGGIRLIQAYSNEPFFSLLTINGHLLAFVAGVSALAPVLFGVVPSLHASQGDAGDALKEGGRRVSGGVKGRRSRAALVVTQLALALMLLVVAGLVTRTVAAVERTPTGIDGAGVLTLQVQLDPPAYRDVRQAVDTGGRLRDRLAELPGVKAAAIATRLPLVESEPTRRFQIDGQPPARPDAMPWASAVSIASDYLRVFGVPLVAGRAFTEHDSGTAPNVGLVSREAARRDWPGASPLGAHVTLAGSPAADRVRLEIVGVVEDVKPSDMTEPAPPRLYRPLAQSPERALTFALRTDGPPAALAPAVRAAVRAIDRDLAVSQIRPFDDLLFDELRENRVLLGMFIAFAGVALLLSGAGLYGVTAYAVSQRTREIGIRMALGARRADVLSLVVGQNLRLMAAGGAVGILGGAALGRAMRSILYRVGAADPATFAAVAVLMLGVALAATLVPARRATGVDPSSCLRGE
ncbi:MAG TPA: ABC transporter permease [Vicinamibacterales bacterium]|nr:ABC transporter permease [Vicinamibacterales bacterium]